MAEPVYEQSKINITSEQVEYLAKHYSANKQLIVNANHWTSFYIGVFWLSELPAENPPSLVIKPKLDNPEKKEDNVDRITDVNQMFLKALNDVEAVANCGDLFKIFDEQEPVPLESLEDNLTPLLVLRYLASLHILVKNGLKKGYRSTTENLNSKVKGKILVAQTIRQNHLKGIVHKTYCNFNEFTTDFPENRYLKLALLFCEKYLAQNNLSANFQYYLNYVQPAFYSISSEIDPRTKFSSRKNPLFKEYENSLQLAEQIIKRFNFQLNEATNNTNIKIFPHWIDVSKLFELYVLGLLKEKFKQAQFWYQEKFSGGHIPDILMKDTEHRLLIDCKYKLGWSENHKEDLRQVSAYSRHKRTYELLEINANCDGIYPLIDCLVIFPNQSLKKEGFQDEIPVLKANEIPNFHQFYTIDVKLPTIPK